MTSSVNSFLASLALAIKEPLFLKSPMQQKSMLQGGKVANAELFARGNFPLKHKLPKKKKTFEESILVHRLRMLAVIKQ